MKYEGHFLTGLFHGAAKIVWTDETNRIIKTFIGEFKRGQRFGYEVRILVSVPFLGLYLRDNSHCSILP